jgi:uncharacterized protein (DUF2267 family)
VLSERVFIDTVAEWTGEPDDIAEALTEGTLRTLAQRVRGSEAQDLAERIPPPLRPFLAKNREAAEVFSYEDFVLRVARYSDVDYETAERGMAAVFRALHEVAGGKEFSDTMAQLPTEFAQLATQPKAR